MLQEKLYPRICLWCKEKGIHTVVGYSKIENSHGMCMACKEEQRETYIIKKKEKNK